MRTWQCVLVCVIAACSKSEPAKTGTGSGTAAVAAPADAAPAPSVPGQVEIFVNDASVAKIGTADIAKWPRLDTLVPEESRRLGTWQVVAIKGDKPGEVSKPSATHPELVPVVFPGEAGAPAFGMFDPVEHAKHGKAGVRHDGVTEIRITVSTEGRGGDHQGGGAGGDPMKLVLAVKTKAGDKQLTGEQIMAIPRESIPGSEDQKGWPLTKLLAAAGVTKFSKLVLVDAGGTSVVLARADFDDKTTIPFIKLNRQGSLRYRLLKKQGTGWQAAGDLRALATIKVE